MDQTYSTNNQIIIYKDDQGPEIKVSFTGDTLWLNQAEISTLFKTERSSVTKHINNIIKSAELSQKNNVQLMHITGSTKRVKYYNLDFIISVGYRVNSVRATQFRRWATACLREYLLKGFIIDQQRLKERSQVKMKELESAVGLLRGVIDAKRLVGYEKELLNIITDYTSTWVLLNQYDHGEIIVGGSAKKITTSLNYSKIIKSIAQFKQRLIKNKQASNLFGREVDNKLQAVLGNIEQTHQGKPLYPSLEEKAAHLLYFAVKDHPFIDGNKRIGALLFLLFLVENHHVYNKKGERLVDENTLTALVLLVAESKPAQKEMMISLISSLIVKK